MRSRPLSLLHREPSTSRQNNNCAERFGQQLYDKITCTKCRTTTVRPLRLADPSTEVESMLPGLKFRLLGSSRDQPS